MNGDTEQLARNLIAVVLAYGDGMQCQALIDDLSLHPDLDPSRIIVVHNPSHPGGTLELADEQQATVIQNSANLGYAAGMNVGVQRALDAEGEHILLLTHDVRIDAQDIDALCDGLAEDGQLAVVGPTLSSPEGTVFSTGMIWTSPTRMAHRKTQRPSGSGPPWDCDGLDGSAMLWRASALRQLGGFDSRFFMYLEDVALCARAVRAGWRVGLVDSAKAVSVPGGSRRRAAHAYLRTRNGLEDARCRGTRYLAFEAWALLSDYWRYTPKPGGTRFGNLEYHVAARAFRRGATLGIRDFLGRRWGPPPARLLRESDIGSTVTTNV